MYQLSIILFYMYLMTLTFLFFCYSAIEIESIKDHKHNCLKSKHWRVLVKLFPLILHDLNDEILIRFWLHMAIHLLAIQLFLNRLFMERMPRCFSQICQLTVASFIANIICFGMCGFELENFSQVLGLMDIHEIDESYAYVIGKKVGRTYENY